jgi:hypothetical protein
MSVTAWLTACLHVQKSGVCRDVQQDIWPGVRLAALLLLLLLLSHSTAMQSVSTEPRRDWPHSSLTNDLPFCRDSETQPVLLLQRHTHKLIYASNATAAINKPASSSNVGSTAM